MTRNRTVVVATTIAALALPAAAQAHVTLQPSSVWIGVASFFVMTRTFQPGTAW